MHNSFKKSPFLKRGSLVRKRIAFALAGTCMLFRSGWIFADDSFMYVHPVLPPSHHLVSPGTSVHADLLVPIDCGLASRGPMVARTTEPLHNSIWGRWNEIILPSGIRIEGSYMCYPRSVYLVFDRFVFSDSLPLSIRCRYASPHVCTHVLEGNTKYHLRVPYGYTVRLTTDHALWLPDSQ